MNNIKVIVSLCLIIITGGCSEQEPAKRTIPVEKVEIPLYIKDQPIAGKVRNTKFNIEQAIIENRTLTLRQGSDFFADTSVSIITFDNGDIEGKTFKYHPVKPGQFQPHIRLGIKKQSKSLPDEITILYDYKLTLKFEKKKELGIPFSIKLVSLKNGTSIEGRSFATYKNIQVKNNTLNIMIDSGDTLLHLAKEYIKIKNKNLVLGKSFGVSYTSNGKDYNYPKDGFVGYEYTADTGKILIFKIQLAKDEDGWKVVNQLNANQIRQAHPVVTNIGGNIRTVERDKAEKVAAQKLEADLNDQALINNIRVTRMNCYLTKAADKASCRGVYGIKHEDKITCQNKNYLLTNVDNAWKVISVILDTERVDYRTGDLIVKKPFSMRCM